MRIICVCFVMLSSGCSSAVQDIYSVPQNPTYDSDVRYFLADHCVLCHGSPPNRGAPAKFRLDVYDVPNSTEPGAYAMAGSILRGHRFRADATGRRGRLSNFSSSG